MFINYSVIVAGVLLIATASPALAVTPARQAAIERRDARLSKQRKPVVSSSSSSSSSVYAPLSNACKTEDWTCTPFSACNSNAKMTRTCTLLRPGCYGEQYARPALEITCPAQPVSNTRRSKMKANMDTWDRMRDDLTKKMESLSSQPKGAGCMSTLASIEGDYVSNYNHYVDIYNNIPESGLNYYIGQMQNIEEAMMKIQDRIKKAPTFCY